MVDIQDEYDEEILDETIAMEENKQLQEAGEKESKRWLKKVRFMESTESTESNKPKARKPQGRLRPQPDIMQKIRMVSYPTNSDGIRLRM